MIRLSNLYGKKFGIISVSDLWTLGTSASDSPRSAAADTWTTIEHSTVLVNDIEGASIGGTNNSQFLLPPGLYIVRGSTCFDSASANSSGGIRLRDVTNDVTISIGAGCQTSYHATSSGGYYWQAVFELTEEVVVEAQFGFNDGGVLGVTQGETYGGYECFHTMTIAKVG